MNKLKIKFDVESCDIEGIIPLEDNNKLELYEAKVKVNALFNVNKDNELVENPDIEIEQFELTYHETKDILINRATHFDSADWETIDVRKIVISEAEGFEIIANPEWSINFSDLIVGCDYINIDLDNLKVYL